MPPPCASGTPPKLSLIHILDGEGRVVDTCGVTLSFSALARLEERLPEGGRTVQVLNVWAVSYTHLDVYKRQVQPHARDARKPAGRKPARLRRP